MAELPPGETDRRQQELMTNGGATLFVNRWAVQTYPENGVRLTFAEQYSADTSIPPVFRTAVFLHTASAIGLAQFLVNALPPGSIILPIGEAKAIEAKPPEESGA